MVVGVGGRLEITGYGFVCRNPIASSTRNFISSQSLFSSRISLDSYNLSGRSQQGHSHPTVQMGKLSSERDQEACPK